MYPLLTAILFSLAPPDAAWDTLPLAAEWPRQIANAPEAKTPSVIGMRVLCEAYLPGRL